MTKSKLHFMPHDVAVEVRNGVSILAAARSAKIPLSSKCGGRGACTTCKVQVTQASAPMPELSRMEKHMLSDRMVKAGFRLGCQCRVTGDLEIEIPEDPLKRTIRLQLEAARREKAEQEQEERAKRESREALGDA
ncbi:MAG TPA: 2Fe-2S iron-sulfur cluster-binding protein [Bacilli bacterium]|nr:2Fe-2S iron-sulfur cluster-binding protein [Bacilli bacterium]